MRDKAAPKAARYLLEIHVTDPDYIEYVNDRIMGDHHNVVRDEDCTIWVYHNTLTGMIDNLAELACMGHIEGAYPHRREPDPQCDACGTSCGTYTWWIHRWYE